MKRAHVLHTGTFIVCIGVGLSIPLSVGAFRSWRAASARAQRPPTADRVCAGIPDDRLPEPLPAGTPFADLAGARAFLRANAASVQAVKHALHGELRARHDRLIGCAGFAGKEHRRLRIIADWRLRVADGTVEATSLAIRSIEGNPGKDAGRIARCFEASFGGSMVASGAGLVNGGFRYSGAYPAPLTLDL
jgi:hypothetical protein